MKINEPLDIASAYDQDLAASLKLWIVLARAYRAVAEHSRRDIEQHGLLPTEFAILEALYHKGSLTIGEVGERILLTSGSMTYMVDKLEKRGLLQRKPCPEDRRVIHLEITEPGRQLMAGIFPEHTEAIERATEGLTLEEKQIATALLKQLGRHAQVTF